MYTRLLKDYSFFITIKFSVKATREVYVFITHEKMLLFFILLLFFKLLYSAK